MQSATNYTGIDISKSFFDVAASQGSAYHYYKFSNNESGFKSLLSILSSDVVVVMEASGPYYLQLAGFLSDHNIAISVINPLVIRRFCQMRLSRAKTDQKDAKMIAAYGRTEDPQAWSPAADYIQ